MAEEPRSRFDLKIARDRLIADLDPLWHQLCDDVEATCSKLRDVYRINLTVQINDQDSVIRVSHAEPLAREPEKTTECTLEFRLEWKQKKVAACVVKRDSRGRDLHTGADQSRHYQIIAEPLTDSLRFFDGQVLRSIEVAEIEIVEKLLHMDLDS